MPKAYAIDALPHFKDPRIRVRAVPPGRVAAVRFSGKARPRDVEAKAKEWNAWMERRGLHAGGAAALAPCDPPWTLGVLRRNGALIPLAS